MYVNKPHRETKVILKEFSDKLEFSKSKNDTYYNYSKENYFLKDLQNIHIKYMLKNKEVLDLQNSKNKNIRNPSQKSLNFFVTPKLCRSHSNAIDKKCK